MNDFSIENLGPLLGFNSIFFFSSINLGLLISSVYENSLFFSDRKSIFD